MKLPLTVAVMTDYTCIPFWEETDCDYYMIPHESLIPEIVKRGIPGREAGGDGYSGGGSLQ